MRLKGKSAQPGEPSAHALEGSWGIIVTRDTVLNALRFSREPDEITSYDYRVVIKWKWRPGPPESIRFIAGPDTVVVTGHGLRRLMDALDEGTLKAVFQEGSIEGRPPRTPYILTIQIEEGDR